jgi:hypothetical protein
MTSCLPRPRLLTAALLAVLASGCGDAGGDRTGARAAAAQHAAAASRSPISDPAPRRPKGCPVTLNNTRIPPPGERPRLEDTTADVYYRNGRLWTILPRAGLIRERSRGDGSIETKLPWWRGLRGRLSISGRRLDAATPRIRAHIPTGYGPIGFQASAIVFPMAGCWSVTGTAGTASLTLVTLVAAPGTQ